MALVKNGAIVADPFLDVSGATELPATGGLLVSLEQWRTNRDALIARRAPLGIRLRSDQHPQTIAADLGHFALVALEFPVFKDGRAYSGARLLRERWGFRGELRAIGDVLLEQLHFMQRVGFDAFVIRGENPLEAWRTASREFSTWYQATADGRRPARELRQDSSQNVGEDPDEDVRKIA